MKRLMHAGLVATVATTLFSGLIGGVTDASARGHMETYTSPTYGVTLDYDDRDWYSFVEKDGAESGGHDLLGLKSDKVPGGVIIEVYDGESDADDCLDSIVGEALADIEDAELIEDEDGEPIEGSSRGTAWAAYSYSDDGTKIGSYFSCQEWGDEDGVVSFSLVTARRDFDDAYELAEPIFDSVDDSDAHPAETDQEDDEDAGDSAGSGTFESEMFGFTVPVNSDHWELQSTDATERSESAEYRGPRREILSILAMEADEGAPLHAYTDYFVEMTEDQLDVDLELYVDPDTGHTVERMRDDEVYTLYTYELDGVEELFYLHAIMSEDGEYVVIVTSFALTTSYDLLEEDVFPLLDQIEFA